MKCPFKRADCKDYRINDCLHRFWNDRCPEAATCYQRDPVRARKAEELRV